MIRLHFGSTAPAHAIPLPLLHSADGMVDCELRLGDSSELWEEKGVGLVNTTTIS